MVVEPVAATCFSSISGRSQIRSSAPLGDGYSTAGLPIQSADALVSLIAFLQQTRMLLSSTTVSTSSTLRLARRNDLQPGANRSLILATSREALRIEGEHAFARVRWMPCPRRWIQSAATALTYPAVKLFVERATAANRTFAFTDSNANVVADICARLMGLHWRSKSSPDAQGLSGLEGTADLLQAAQSALAKRPSHSSSAASDASSAARLSDGAAALRRAVSPEDAAHPGWPVHPRSGPGDRIVRRLPARRSSPSHWTSSSQSH